VLEEDRVPVYRITRRPYVPYEPERRYMEDPSLPQAASRFRSMLGLPTRQGPEEGNTKANPLLLLIATEYIQSIYK